MSRLDKAKSLLKENDSNTCAITDGSTVYVSTERGIRPLIKLIRSGKSCKGFSAADRIIGKAAAFLYVKLGVAEVYAEVMSAEGKRVIEENGIECSFDTLTQQIRNRKGDDICPMEKAVKDIDDAEHAYSVLTEKSGL
jgi:hypothetical protein